MTPSAFQRVLAPYTRKVMAYMIRENRSCAVCKECDISITLKSLEDESSVVHHISSSMTRYFYGNNYCKKATVL